MIVSGSTSQSLAAALAAELGEPLGAVEQTAFPDGESKFALAPPANKSFADVDRAVIVASTTTAEAHLEVLQLQDAAREADINEVVTVLPYMGYGRQDRAFEAGEPVTARAIAQALSAGTDRILTVTPHEPDVCEFFDPPATAVDAEALLAEPLQTTPDPTLADPLFLSPDAGAIEIAETVRDAYGAGAVDHFEKTRNSGTDVSIEPGGADVADRDVVVVDDIVATGSTMSESIGVLQDRGVDRVFVACVHPLLARDARSKLARAGVEAIVATDTIERTVSTVSAAPAIAEEL
ncbi:ribose-phosphate pyrophosphokinase [Salinarchaeum chitinilyticum]